jgi:hypothetical protein
MPHEHMDGLRSAFARGADRYDILLLIVVISMMSAPFETAALRPVFVAILAVAWLFVLWTSNAPVLAMRLAAALSVVAVIVAGLAQLGSSSTAQEGFTVAGTLLSLAIIVSTARALTQRIHNTARLLAGALSIYLLFGLIFAYVYALIAEVHTGGFFAQPGPFDPTSYLYYSFITMTTVGFGDLTSNNNLGRMITVLEALLGQIYLVTVIAVVVTNRPSRRSARAEVDSTDE